ncbi:MAG: helix-turn-helix domain-containing protein [Iphinoe sp. HA4291-MV1]|jgi:YesN/AraC family two-component response regulator|nr:helix-turn-helix domain-containing protein [Iphinoe sp. HA4291-MV1]
MEDFDGYNFLNTLYINIFTITKIISFICLTSQGAQADICKDIDLKADNYLLKPNTLKQLLAAIAPQLEKQTAHCQDFFEAYAQQLLELPSTNTASITDQQSIFQSTPILKEVFDFIEANYHQPITLNDVAQAVGYSPAYLTNLVREQTGQSLYRWITYRRMVQASFLLLGTDQTVNQIADNLGYRSVASFCRQFRQFTGKNPSAWRSERRFFFELTEYKFKSIVHSVWESKLSRASA